MLTVRGVSKTYAARPAPVRAVEQVDLTVVEGSFTAVLGASGCGKTTLLRVIAGFDQPDQGEVRLGGRLLTGPGTHIPPERRSIGIVPQEGALFPHLDVAQNIGFGLVRGHIASLSRRARRDRATRIDEMLELVGLAGYGKRRPDELSGGQQQRVALARALAPDPEVILLDEPFSSLDADLRAELRVEVRELLRRVGTTAVLVTHDQDEALSLADHIAVMRNGKIVQVDSPHGVYGAPNDPHIAEFIGDAVLLPARLIAGRTPAPCVECALGRVGLLTSCALTGGDCMVMLRPEQLELSDDGTLAQVVSTMFYGHDGIVRLRLGADGSGPMVLVRTQGHALPKAGDTVAVRVAGGVEAQAFQMTP
ncbi:MAG TPA: ABC transporter ATP-binding protein [Thermomicrobiales bacterium]|nr:ABC transporter ATP-binding protein [Thermomicrobiales bacterium]